MAITKIHPIEKTLYLALDYIMNEDKTDEKNSHFFFCLQSKNSSS